MHKASLLRMQWFLETFVSKQEGTPRKRVLDVGSYDINGSYKQLFNPDCFDYTGMDMEAGPNVDLVLKNPYDWSLLQTDSFDLIVCGQVFEHAEFFWITMSEMTRVLKKDGLLCVIVPNVLEEHRYPVDCYRFNTDGMVAMARYVNLEVLHAHTNCAPKNAPREWYSTVHTDSMLVARKNYEGDSRLVNLSDYECVQPNQQELRSGLLPFKESNFLIRLLRKFLKKRDVKRQRLRRSIS